MYYSDCCVIWEVKRMLHFQLNFAFARRQSHILKEFLGHVLRRAMLKDVMRHWWQSLTATKMLVEKHHQQEKGEAKHYTEPM